MPVQNAFDWKQAFDPDVQCAEPDIFFDAKGKQVRIRNLSMAGDEH
jgi:hypothetical protein